jgi:chemotaxis protein CheZ
MPVQRKVFRIEEMSPGAAFQTLSAGLAEADSYHGEILTELKALRALLEPVAAARDSHGHGPHPQQREARKLKIELDVIADAIRQTKNEITTLQDRGFDGAGMGRVAQELDAVVVYTEQATQRILNVAEEIEQTANMLSAMLQNNHQQGMAQDIADQVTRIFEACNFHDLTGQRLAKVAGTMKLVEEHIARMMEIWTVIAQFQADEMRAATASANALMDGPNLGDQASNSAQAEIDALFP